MHVAVREANDLKRLRSLARNEHRSKQRDRYRMVVLALEGREKLEIAALLGVAKSTVEHWVYRYRDQGIEALTPRKQCGARSKLTPAQCEAFTQRLLAGPREGDGVCTLRGKDAVRILNEEFGASYSLPGVYHMLHRLNFSCLKPRPRHEKNDPLSMAQFRKDTPFFSSG